ncbi:MAG: cation-binding protein [Chitinivibrionales bacterium]|nr:cation-binding protein [Chitinivibrionales bacterium]
MQIRGPLMKEHRLIERMISVARNELARIRSIEQADPLFIDTIVDFLRTYADRTHHGKEEDILFKDLGSRSLTEKDNVMMNELIREHVFARQTTGALVDANNRYRTGDTTALPVMAEKIQILIDFYPQHIEKEDKIFFPAARTYLSDKEEQDMLFRFREFDRKMIHEKYAGIVDEQEKKPTINPAF